MHMRRVQAGQAYEEDVGKGSWHRGKGSHGGGAAERGIQKVCPL